MALDSGAADHVVNSSETPGYQVSDSPGSKAGACFAAANGGRIPNRGQVELKFRYKPKIYKRSFQKADVKKTHGSNSRIKYFYNKKKFVPLETALNNTCNWYKKNWKIFT